MEKILKIEEVHDVDGRDGFAITTDKQVVKLLIDNCQCCCENWGYLMSEYSFESFIGSRLLDVAIVDTKLNSKKLEDYDAYEGDTMFVNLITSEGVLQFIAYNEHNGYYGHYACVISEQLNYHTCL